MRTTEQESLYDDLENKSVSLLLSQMNQEDQKVADAVSEAIPQIQDLVQHILPRMIQGGRLFYIGAGTSGRLGILDASECPPTFGVSNNHVIGLIAGGDGAIREAVEFAEDQVDSGWEDLKDHKINDMDSVIGIAASGTTPYVVEALNTCRKENILTGCITCNENSPLSQSAEFPVEVVVGPEFITGSTRMKAGTAQKLVLNMISTTLMIKLGKVQGNKMVDMQLSNDKLVDRGSRMVVDGTDLDFHTAKKYLLKYGSVRAAVKAYKEEK
jgi:N-acetylmuramic acid 6-phosphate etherase